MSLYIPLRQTVPIDLGGEIRDVIQKHYFQSPSMFDRELSESTKLRQTLANMKDLEVTSASERDIKAYLVLIDSISAKFADEIVEFGWYLTLYSLSGPDRVRSLRFEKENVWFQLAAVYSQLAYKESCYNDEGLKRACGYYQRAAGCIQQLEGSQFFDKTTLDCLHQLMLAEAQESFFTKATSSNTKDSVIARLAIQTSEYYNQALIHGDASKHIRLEWLNLMRVKRFHYVAIAHLRLAAVKLDEFQYGEQVAHLKAASDACKSAAKHLRYVEKIVLDDLSGLTTSINESLKVAEFDNDLVYLKPVPKELKPIVGAPMVKAIETVFENKKTYFADLLPFTIIQIAQAFRERQDNYVNSKFVEPLNALIKMMAQFLASRNLPASIDTIQRPENIPDSIIEHSQEISSLGGIRIIESSFDAIKKLAWECDNLVEGCQERIRIEADEDDILRNLKGSRWNRLLSKEASAELQKKVDNMREYLEQAERGDEHIWDQYETIRPYLDAYAGGFRALKNLVPSASPEDIDPEVSNIILQLREAVIEATDLTKRLKNFHYRLELKARDNNILPRIIDEYKKAGSQDIDTQTMELIYKKHLTIFNDDSKHFEDLKKQQIQVESKIDQLNNAFVQRQLEVGTKPKSARQKTLEELEYAFSQYLELVSNLNEGSKFYNDFLNRGSAILKDCDNYLLLRRAEGRELELLLSDEQKKEMYEDHDPLSQVISPQAKSGTWNPSHGISFE